MLRTSKYLLAIALFSCYVIAESAASPAKEYEMADRELRVELIDTNPNESFLAIRADTQGRLFVGGRESLFVYEPNASGGYEPRQLLFQFPKHSWIYDVEILGNDLYVLTMSALYVVPDAVTTRTNLQPKKLIWGVPHGHVHQCFHALAWGPEGDLYISMGDPLWYYGDFDRPDHWGYWHFAVQPEGTRIPYHGVGGVFRCRPDGSGFQVVAGGLRNPCGLVFDKDWNLFTNDNDHESLPAKYVPGRLLHVTPHAYFSWPRGWMAKKAPERADLLKTMFDGMGRAVPVGMCYYDEAFFPQEYRNNLLLARWGTREVTRYPLQPRGASFSAHEQPLLAGQNIARPVGVCVGRGGRVFATVAHMANNEESPVYKSDLVMITRADDPATHPFDPYRTVEATADRLWQELSNPSWNRRYRAHQEILRRSQELTEQAAERLAKCARRDPSFVHLIWLTAAAHQDNGNLALLMDDQDPLIRAQVVRAMSSFSHKYKAAGTFERGLHDADSRVQLAALCAFFNPELELSPAAWSAVVKGPAVSTDTYLRQTAAFLLAERASLEFIEQLTRHDQTAVRLAGILAAGFRLTVPKPTEPLDDKLPLVTWYNGDQAYVIDFADGKADLRSLGRLGIHTLAEHWKAVPHTAEQTRLAAILCQMLNDDHEANRFQAGYFLSLLNDSAIEPQIAQERENRFDRKLAAAPLQAIEELWVVGPFADGDKGLTAVHPPESGAIDLVQTYQAGGSTVSWSEIKGGPSFNLGTKFGQHNLASFYAFTRLETPGNERIELHVGSDDGVCVWHNGRQVLSRDVTRAVAPSQERVLLDLQPGGNDLLVRVRNETGDCGLDLRFRGVGHAVAQLPERVSTASLQERLRDGQQAGGAVASEFLEMDWTKAIEQGDSRRGRQLFASLACNKCHAISNDASVIGGPSLAEARRRFTIPYLVESILAPSKQISPVFKSTLIQTEDGNVLTGFVVKETAESLEVLLPDASRKTLPVAEIESRKIIDQSPMPLGLVRKPEELRDLLAYIMSEDASVAPR